MISFSSTTKTMFIITTVYSILLVKKKCFASAWITTLQAKTTTTAIQSMRKKLYNNNNSSNRQYRFYSSTSNNNDGSNCNNFNNNNKQSLLQLYLPNDPYKMKPIKTVVAPMVAASDYAFRCLTRQYGADLTFTQMLHSKNIINHPSFIQNHYDLYEYHNHNEYLSNLLPSQIDVLKNDKNGEIIDQLHIPPDDNAIKGPVIVQLAGDDVSTIVKAAEIIISKSNNDNIAGIDLNLGCPQQIAKKGNYGAYLMENNPNNVYKILHTLRNVLPTNISVSAKIRLPMNRQLINDRIHRLCETGINFLTIHGRDLTENKTKVQGVHINDMKHIIRIAKDSNNIPVIANGGIESYNDINTILHNTNAAAIMSSEAILEYPYLFDNNNNNANMNITPKERFYKQIYISKLYIQWCKYAPPLPGVLGYSYNIIRGHLFKFLHTYLQENHDIRDLLANNNIHQKLHHAETIINTLEERYSNIKTDDEWNELPSSNLPHTSWYRRHWKNNSKVHTRKRFSVGTSSSTSSNNENNNNQCNNNIMTIEERKQQIKINIAQLKQQNKNNRKSNNNFSSHYHHHDQ